MAQYEVVMSVVVEAYSEDDAFQRALDGRYNPELTIVEEDGVRRLPDPIDRRVPEEAGR